MKVSELKAPKGARKTPKRRGLGSGSGSGKTSGRGHKGSGARTGFRKRPGFEGGQMPLIRRIPKRGFRPFNRTEYQVVNLADIEKIALSGTITPQILQQHGLIKKAARPVKILAGGELSHAVIIQADSFSQTAQEKIAAQGGTVKRLKR